MVGIWGFLGWIWRSSWVLIAMAFEENGGEGLAEVGGRQRWVGEYGGDDERF